MCWPSIPDSLSQYLNIKIGGSLQCKRMCCSFYWYLPTIKSSPTGYHSELRLKLIYKLSDMNDVQSLSCRCKVAISSENQFQHLELHHLSCITLSKLQHMLWGISAVSSSPPASAVEVIKTEEFVCVCVCVWVCVSVWTLSRLNRLMYGHKIWCRDWPWWNLGRVWWSRS